MKTSPMLVVSDADVIIHLSKLDKLSILHSLYNEVAIPEYIKHEITGKDNPAIHKAINSFFKVFATSKDKAEVFSLLEKMKSQDFRIHSDILQKAAKMLEEI